jgi:uncharacterized Tic20 family protein
VSKAKSNPEEEPAAQDSIESDHASEGTSQESTLDEPKKDDQANMSDYQENPPEAASGSPVPPRPPSLSQPLSPSDERTWAMLAHLSVLANLVTGLLGPVIALVIYLAFRERSRYVAYQSMQAFIFQLIWWIGGGALAALAWTISGLLSAILIGCCLMPFALLISLIPLGALVYGAVAAIQTSQGQDFKYWLIGDWVRGTLPGN